MATRALAGPAVAQPDKAGVAPFDDASAVSLTSMPVRVPRIAILSGAACAYPYSGYYAHSLASVGLPFDILDGEPIAQGALDAFELLILPGGFETWGLDRNERTPGIDAAIRRFFARGGAAIASCGGAFYLSEGRTHWLGVARASPRYTHEYLRSGAGLVSLELDDGPLAHGLAPVLEMPYYHGPIYEAVRAPARAHARFCALSLAARLPIDNPLDPERFAAEMAGKAAIVTAGGANRAVLFSPHPEMGDVVRKYIALDSYVARYLPVRGPAVLEQTLDFYTPNDTPSFRLVLNAVYHLCAREGSAADVSPPAAARREAAAAAAPSAWQGVRDRLLGAVEDTLQLVVPSDDACGRLIVREVQRLRSLAAHQARCAAPNAGMRGAQRVVHDAAQSLAGLAAAGQRPDGTRALAQHLLAVELALRILEAFARMAQLDHGSECLRID
jgi:hypothetical protein